MKRLFAIIPWGLAVLFLALWLGLILDRNLGYYYDEQGYTQMSINEIALENYITSRRGFETDLDAFESLQLIDADQYNGKYEPWTNTKLGLIRFDESGFITDICQLPAHTGDQNCPPQL